MKLKPLNSKELKPIYQYLKKQFDYYEKLGTIFLSEKDKLYLFTGDINNILIDSLKINSLGLYIGEWRNDELRLSVEGAQLIYLDSKNNILTLDEKQAKAWMKGQDIQINSNLTGFQIIKFKKDIIGCGKIKNNNLLNFLSKSRRCEIH